MSSKSITSENGNQPIDPTRPVDSTMKWAAVAMFVIAIGALGVGGYYGGLAWHSGSSLLQSTLVKASLIGGASLLVLGTAFAVISKIRNKGTDLASGLLKSKIVTPFLLSGLAVAGLYAISHFTFGGHPPSWMIAAAATGGFAVGVLIQLPFKGIQKIRFEISALLRLPQKNYDEIYEKSGKKIFLGALPNRLRSDGEKLVDQEQVGAVLSINETWERSPLGISLPYDNQHWQALEVEYKGMDVLDHTLLSDDQLDEVAEFIHEQIRAGRNVYIHCRAGCGRSAMGLAAYLIKYENKSAQEAGEIIKEKRPVSTIRKKLERLKAYETYYRSN